MKIRFAQQNDAHVIATQNMALAKESENIILDPDIVLAGVHSVLADINKGFYLVVENNNKIIGQLMITTEWSDWRNKPIWWVQSVYVQKNWRKKGVFTKMLMKLRQYAKNQNVAFLRLYVCQSNHSALQVYKKVGWNQEPYEMYQITV
ncbi:hypothetical protein AYK25_02990 [Thermoplasmatales archaeon SM1-50]|nr:MAG: hypothetical protein AYK25_02990 [Thermoplasmatales archaeon SM1-50]